MTTRGGEPDLAAIRAIVFDMDGLLIDSERAVRRCTLTVADRMGRPMDEAFYRRLIGQPFAAVSAMLREHFGSDAALEEFREAFMPLMQAETKGGAFPLMAGVVELLDHVDALGLPMAVCTSTHRARALHHLERTGIAHRFQVVVGGDEVARGKPHPDPYRLAADRLGVAPAECLAFEDSHNGIRAAHAAGMVTVMVPDLMPCTDEIRAFCHHVLDDLHAARSLIGVRAARRR